MNTEIKQLVSTLGLEPHPEGGFYKETYRSDSSFIPSGFKAERAVSTCIYFMLTSGSFSAFHRIKSDEVWHFYKGAPIQLHIISGNGTYRHVRIGNDILNGEHPQFMVKAGDWFASEVHEKDAYALAGCTVAPGFDFTDFEMAQRDALCKEYPMHKDIIQRLTRI
jgi:predicted cupin superfamily sugar epimerase